MGAKLNGIGPYFRSSCEPQKGARLYGTRRGKGLLIVQLCWSGHVAGWCAVLPSGVCVCGDTMHKPASHTTHQHALSKPHLDDQKSLTPSYALQLCSFLLVIAALGSLKVWP